MFSDIKSSLLGGAGSRLIGILGLVLLARIYLPEHLGTYSLVLAAASILVPISTQRLEIAVVLPRTKRIANSILCLIFGMAFVVFIATLGLLAWKSDEVSKLLGLDGALLYWIPILAALLSLQTALQAWLSRERNYWSIAVSQLAQAIALVILAFILAHLFGASGPNFVKAAVLSLALGVLINFSALARAGFAIGRRGLAATNLLRVVRRYRAYPLYMVPYSLSSVVADRFFQILLASYFSTSALGLYYFARQLVYAPTAVVCGSLRPVFFSHAARLDPAIRRSLIERLLLGLGSVQLPALAFCFVFLDDRVDGLFGEKWSGIGVVMAWVVLPSSTLMLTAWLDRVFDLLNRQRYAVVLQLVSDAVLIVTAWTMFQFHVTEVQAIAVISSVVAAYNVIWLWLTLRAVGFSKSKIFLLFSKGSLLYAVSYTVFRQIDMTYSPMRAAVISLPALVVLILFGVFVIRRALVGRVDLASSEERRV